MKRITCIFMVSLLVLTMLFCACEESGGKTAVDLTVNEAIELLNNGKYEEAYAKFFSIKNSTDVSAYLDRFVWVCTGEKYTNHSGTFTRSTEYICNDYGYVMTAVESDSNGGESRTDYRYETDEGGKLLEKVKAVNNETVSTVLYSYTQSGLLAEEKYITDAFGEYSIAYEYDGAGNLVFVNYGFPEAPYTVEYTYDDQGRLIEEKQVYEVPIPQTTTKKYVYDDNGQIIGGEIISQNYDGSETVTTREYENGLLIRETEHYYDGDVTLVYEYDAYRNLVKVTSDTTTEYSYQLFYR